MADEVEGKNGGTLKPFQPGQSGNPGGLTKELRAQIDANAAMATRIRTAMLAKYAALIDPDGMFMGDVAEAHPVVKSSEERGMGAPKQTVEADVGFTKIRRIIMKEE
jgi:hypothetical protein